MILYFSGTGNSRYAAETLARSLDEKTADISVLLRENCRELDLTNEKRLGFVFPVYYSGLPTVVSHFLDTVKFILPSDVYVFCVITCGGSAAGADTAFRKRMAEKKHPVAFTASVKMPDNYVLLYNPATQEEAKKTMQEADKTLASIGEQLRQMQTGGYNSGFSGKLACGVMQPMYQFLRSTKRFFADDKCTGCGACETLCPENVIRLIDGKPTWTQKKCAHCTACINRCPARAIQYGKATEKRGRYQKD